MNAKKNIERIRTNPKIKVFLVLLFLSAVYWFFTSLSEKYIYQTTYTINYTNIPENLLFQNTPSNQIQVQIEATGFEILSHKLRTKSLSFDLSEFKTFKKYSYYYLPNKQIHSIQKQIKKTQLIHFNQDSLIVFLGNLKTKRVPIISQVQLSYKSGYKLTTKLLIVPDSLTIKGPEKYINNINSIQTSTQELIDINQDFNITTPLLLPKKELDKLSFDVTEVKLIGEVSKFTEGTLELDIHLPQIPENVHMELFPKIATIKYEVTFDNYQKIDSTSFHLTCKYPTENSRSKKKLELFLSDKPDFIKEYTIKPQEVTYLIRHLKSKENLNSPTN